MVTFSSIFGGGTTSASDQSLAAQIAANRETSQFIDQQTGIARGDISGAIPQQLEAFQTGAAGAQSALQPFVGTGAGAFEQQGALAGVGGPLAQQAAFDAFIASPGQEFLRQQGEQATLRGAAATGGLGGGNVQEELVRRGIGFAAQDFQNQFNRLGTLSNIGAQTAGQQAGLSQQAGAGQANIIGQGASSLAELASNAAAQRVNIRALPQLQRDPGVLPAIGAFTSGVGTGLGAIAGEQGIAKFLGLGGGSTAATLAGGAEGAVAPAIAGGATALGGSGAALAGGAGTLTAPGALAPGAISSAPLAAPGAAPIAGGTTAGGGILGGFGTGGATGGAVAGGLAALAAPILLGLGGPQRPTVTPFVETEQSRATLAQATDPNTRGTFLANARQAAIDSGTIKPSEYLPGESPSPGARVFTDTSILRRAATNPNLDARLNAQTFLTDAEAQEFEIAQQSAGTNLTQNQAFISDADLQRELALLDPFRSAA